MPVQGLFNDDARNVGGRTRILKRHWRHENKIASAKPSVFVPSRQRKQRQKAKRNTIKSALRPVPSVVTKRSTSRRSQPAKSPVRSKTPNESKLHDDVDDLTESKLDISHNESKREDKETSMMGAHLNRRRDESGHSIPFCFAVLIVQPPPILDAGAQPCSERRQNHRCNLLGLCWVYMN